MKMPELKHVARVHRFHGKAALHIQGGPTFYLTMEEARALSKGLRNCALDIERHDYGVGKFSEAVIMPSAPLYIHDASGMTRQPELDERNARELARANRESKS